MEIEIKNIEKEFDLLSQLSECPYIVKVFDVFYLTKYYNIEEKNGTSIK